MADSSHEYAITVCRQDGSVLGRFPVAMDWEPVGEWARFAALRDGALSPEAAAAEEPRFEPVFAAGAGEPRVACVRARAGGAWFDLSGRYFQRLAEALSPRYVQAGLLQDGEVFRFWFSAVPKEAAPEGAAAPAASGFRIEAVRPALPIAAAPMPRPSERPAAAPEEGNRGDYPVFVPARVLHETAGLTLAAGSLETGGILKGRLCRDVASSELFAIVTGQVPAAAARGELSRLTFTPAAWAALRETARLRPGEVWLGWWHSHSYLQAAPADAKERTAAHAGFMSADDCALHRTCFPAAFSLALVVSNAPAVGLTWHLFGWQEAAIAGRGFFILDDGAKGGEP